MKNVIFESLLKQLIFQRLFITLVTNHMLYVRNNRMRNQAAPQW